MARMISRLSEMENLKWSVRCEQNSDNMRRSEFIHEWAGSFSREELFSFWWHPKHNFRFDSIRLPGPNCKSAGPADWGGATGRGGWHLKGKRPLAVGSEIFVYQPLHTDVKKKKGHCYRVKDWTGPSAHGWFHTTNRIAFYLRSAPNAWKINPHYCSDTDWAVSTFHPVQLSNSNEPRNSYFVSKILGRRECWRSSGEGTFATRIRAITAKTHSFFSLLANISRLYYQS